MSPVRETPEILLREGSSQLILFPGQYKLLLLENFTKRIFWQQNKIQVFGKQYDEPRLTAWYGPEYSYSRIHWPKKPMPDFLIEIINDLHKYCEVEFNSVLLNYYRDGADSMGWHSDNEPEMDTRWIASISLGGSRIFALRKGKSGASIRTTLEHGDLLLMKNLQDGWQHSIPKKTGSVGPRLNMTFRRILDLPARL